ncbi:hypothetical protein EV137_5196 [Kribbella pratensis]|uniref:MBL fold metallo-hydrolase n=1 Tax=Kribbella pratensis TaxID=2512112 RepID=A0ABY2F973_9ACTN|nr:hypothetical protein EV137_5196 [Kribbella pratensis]
MRLYLVTAEERWFTYEPIGPADVLSMGAGSNE